jgi:hypothetical protein
MGKKIENNELTKNKTFFESRKQISKAQKVLRDFKILVVKKCVEKGEKIKEIAQDIDISISTAYRYSKISNEKFAELHKKHQ